MSIPYLAGKSTHTHSPLGICQALASTCALSHVIPLSLALICTELLIGMQGSPIISAQFGPTAGRKGSWGEPPAGHPIFSTQINPVLGRVISGWLNYYAVPGTSRTLANFVQAIKRMLMRTLRRRSQKDRYSWPALDRLIGFHWPKPTIRHPWPNRRLIVNTRGRSRMR